MPIIEARPACGQNFPYRVGIHLLGDLFIDTNPTPSRFDAWVRLDPAVVTDSAGVPFGSLAYGAIEGIVPEQARDRLEAIFLPGGTVGAVLADLKLDLFTGLLEAITRVLHPPVHEDDPVTINPAEFVVAFEVGEPASLRRPLYVVDAADDPVLDID